MGIVSVSPVKGVIRMAEQKQASVKDNNRSASAGAGEAAKPASLGDRIADMLGKAWDFVTGDKYLNAMARQGANELGSALKAFPDSIAEYRWVHADDKDSQSVGRSPWPSEVAEMNRLQPGKDHGNGHENDAGYSM
jgi:hypothetical protein